MTRRRLAAVLLAATALVVSATQAQPGPDLEPAEVRRILRHGPWPEPVSRDPSNRASGDPLAIALGQRLFFDARLSAGGAIACATCHVPERAWTDGRARGVGLALLDRNTPSLLDALRHRWLGWDGGADSLWAQGLRALVDPREMGTDSRHVAGVVAGD